MINGALVMLAQPFNQAKHGDNVNGWYVSEKLDGQRAIWLPFTRNDFVSTIPFANRERDPRDHVATGLWSRYGKPIFAPDWWLDNLPTDRILDGELYVGRGQFQTVSSYVRKHPAERSDSEWRCVSFKVFDSPDAEQFFAERRIYSPNYKTVLSGLLPSDIVARETFIESLGLVERRWRSFEDVYTYLSDAFPLTKPVVQHLPQTCLPFHTQRAIVQLDEMYRGIVECGGEGVILRKYSQLWEPIRSHGLVKMKPVNDSEGTIIGFSLGLGKYDKMIGALLLNWKGHTFELSGFTDAERTLNCADYWCGRYPAKQPLLLSSEEAQHGGINFSPTFKIGDRITFSYRELTDKGLPKEARFLRPRLAFE